MKKETVTRNDLRQIEKGASITYELPNLEKVASVRAMAAYLKSHEGRNLTCTAKGKQPVITITRLA